MKISSYRNTYSARRVRGGFPESWIQHWSKMRQRVLWLFVLCRRYRSISCETFHRHCIRFPRSIATSTFVEGRVCIFLSQPRLYNGCCKHKCSIHIRRPHFLWVFCYLELQHFVTIELYGTHMDPSVRAEEVLFQPLPRYTVDPADPWVQGVVHGFSSTNLACKTAEIGWVNLLRIGRPSGNIR